MPTVPLSSNNSVSKWDFLFLLRCNRPIPQSGSSVFLSHNEIEIAEFSSAHRSELRLHIDWHHHWKGIWRRIRMVRLSFVIFRRCIRLLQSSSRWGAGLWLRTERCYAAVSLGHSAAGVEPSLRFTWTPSCMRSERLHPTGLRRHQFG